MHEALFVLAVGIGVGSGVTLTGCAGTGGTHPDSASKTSLTSFEIDSDKVATVNRWALDRGARLIWINYPQKRLSGDDNRGH